MIPEAYRDAHSDVDIALTDLRGLTRALYTIATTSSCIDETSPDAISFNALIRCIEAKVLEAEALQQRAWDALGAEVAA